MKNSYFDKKEFVIHNFQKQKHFSSFLPAIAGVDGKPLWVFYANVGQCLGGFGVDDKEGAMSPFDSAFNAYGNIPLKGFRTLINVDGKQFEPFKNSTNTTLRVARSYIVIEDDNDYFNIKVTYSTISHKPYPGLIRKVDITSYKTQNIGFVDGLSVFLPRGLGNYAYHHLSTLMSAYCRTKVVDGIGLYSFSGGEDSAEVKKNNNVSSFFSVDSNNKKIDIIFDKDVVFNDETFVEFNSFNKIVSSKGEQVSLGKIPCAFISNKVSLKEGETYSFISAFSSAEDSTAFIHHLKELSYCGLNKMFDETNELCESLLPKIKTSNSVFDEYVKQSYFDNGLRGGFPTKVGNRYVYVYSRKHGDMERDYNNFEIPSTYFSSGVGNFRDVNQNRRNDLYQYPELFSRNIKLFYNLIEANGFNPLIVDDKVLREDVNDFEEASELIKNQKDDIRASYHEGYWVDHFVYNTDLIENFVSVFPDKVEEALNDKDYKFFDSHVHIKPHTERYKFVNEKYRQYDSLMSIEGTSDWLLDKNGSPIKVNLASKLFHLIVLKYVMLDSYQNGIEMIANKPGWNDACNGLPGIFGSSLCETIELLKLIKVYIKLISNSSVTIQMINAAKSLFESLMKLKGEGYSYYVKQRELLEEYEDSYRLNNDIKDVDVACVLEALDIFEKRIEESLKKISKEHPILPTYFINEPIINGKKEIIGFNQRVVPYFLEAPARALHVSKDLVIPQNIENSGLFDGKLNIFKTSESLENESFEIGRIRSFNPGWLERESDFLHMTFKYLLGLLDAGYYEEFFKYAKTNVPCFMNPETYGRPLNENVSFIVPSNNVDSSRVGQGFYARLTGANAEVISAINIMFFGKNLFSFKDETLSFDVEPHIPLSLFDNGKVTMTLFSSINVSIFNKNNKECMRQKISYYVIDGEKMDKVNGDIALKIRNKQVKNIEVYIE